MKPAKSFLLRVVCASLAFFAVGEALSFASDVGMVAPFISTFCPAGWVPTGTTVYENVYPELYTLADINSTWGHGSDGGIGWEATPNLGGEFIRGWDNGRGIDSGRTFGSAQVDNLQGHYHAPLAGTSFTVFNLTNPLRTFGGGAHFGQDNTTGNPVTGTNGTPRYGNETRPRNIALLYCIKAVSDIQTGGSSMQFSTFTLVDISTTAAAAMTPGIFKYFTIGDLSFFFGVLMGLVVIWGFKAGGMR